MTIENKKITSQTNIQNKNRLGHQFVVITVVMFAVSLGYASIPNAEAVTDCITLYGSHCYATHTFSATSSTVMHGIQSTYKVIDQVRDGFVSSPTWAILNDGSFIEIGWIDGGGTIPVQYYVALNGNISTPPGKWGSPSNNTSMTFTVYDLNKDSTWDLIGGGSSWQYARSSPTAWKIESGYEIVKNNQFLAKNDYNNLKVMINSVWSLWGTSTGNDGIHSTPSGETIYYVLKCGSATEQHYHSQHGHVPKPGACT